jgi:hypothetical protein
MRLEELGSNNSENSFTLHILKNMTDDYDVQLAMMEKQATDNSNPLTVNEIWDDLNMRFKQNEESENNKNQEVEFLLVNLKENVKIVV